MIRGLYTSASALMTGMEQHEIQLHNLANLNTIGYKADGLSVSEFPTLLMTRLEGDVRRDSVGAAGTGVGMTELVTDWSEGPLELTEHPLDFAIGGEGFFRIQSEEGIRYTRDGRFHQDATGRLVTANGDLLLGEGDAPIQLPQGEVTVSPTGEIWVDGQQVARFSLARFDDPADLVKVGESAFEPRNGAPQLVAAAEVNVQQGYLEGSNVDPTVAVTNMMSVVRAYQLSQRMVQLQDQITSRSVNEIGRL